MALTSTRITELLLEQLAIKETRLLTLTVAVRKGLGTSAGTRGDLSQIVRAALRKLILARKVVDSDGVFALSREMKSRKR